MWNRGVLKLRARQLLGGFYWLAFVACLIVEMIMVVVMNFVPKQDYGQLVENAEEVFEIISANLMQYIGIYLSAMILSALVGLFISGPLVVGLRRFFRDAVDGKKDISNLLYAFKNNYMNIVKVIFFRNVFIFLWELLVFAIGYGLALLLMYMEIYYLSVAAIAATAVAMIIVGVIKSIQYFYVDLILSRDSRVGYKEALDGSKRLACGDVGRLFMLRLSFLVWIVLGMMACYVGVAFVEPYIYTTEDLLYRVKNEEVNGICEFPARAF